MRLTAIILGILGGLIALGLGIHWLNDLGEAQASIETLRAAGALSSDLAAELEGRSGGAYCLILAFVLSLVGTVMIVKNQTKPAGALMLVGAILPAFFAGGKVIIFTFFLLLGGICALMAKPK